MSSSWGYFIEGVAYREHIKKYATQEDISTCTSFATLMHTNTRFHKGYATTGVAMAINARHGFVLPNGVSDLQKGERYVIRLYRRRHALMPFRKNCNIDYIALSALFNLPPPAMLPYVLSYDIMCQWLRWLLQRMASLPHHLQIELPVGEVRYAIPKYHLNGHKEEGHNQYSLNFMRGVEWTDSEEVKRGWSRMDGTAASTREMGPGSREETLEDHFGFNNQEKYINMGMTEAEIRLQLAKEEEEATSGSTTLHEVTPVSMILTLVDLEEQQRKFRKKYPSTASDAPPPPADGRGDREACHAASPDQHDAKCPGRLHALRHAETGRATTPAHRRALRVALATVVLSAPPHVSEIEQLDVPERQPLFLPHELEEDNLESCVAGLADMESRLRDGQLSDSLNKLRVHLHICSCLVRFKDRHVRHQRPNTRACIKIKQNEIKIVTLKKKYRAAWRAKLALVGHGAWERSWKELLDSDVTTMRGDDEVVGVGTSEGKHTLS
ncbi:hypothetical protein PsYK624_171390 [Phanerochaete sordida]|uniref:Uncharacterized protein n=1 Tax=Phanerochaete sordida TaxID=48140 RepID=A0A9P3GT36_9APHY|nr:hypothetical protein PsYK624_171390 [Phanerochaete sordida]